ncbi:hypothetical protein ACHHYP_10987 [Achlya hypogyna]|uniref:Transmembrane protein n=1 Tax=Achlya hypogyna TaxID=1202772 RepID=A0A1V9YK86_ACHHY|nr:hypothetical protein ACHHYP_10987 [Achlya hypogyna]
MGLEVAGPVTPVIDWSQPLPSPTTNRFVYVEAAIGLMYLAVSVACGVWYVSMLSPSFANDLWWAGFNLSGHEAFLIDLVNSVLATTAATSLNVYAAEAVVTKSYVSAISYTNVAPTYARNVIFNELTTIEYAVPNLRRLSASWSMRMNVQHCWVDFNRDFEVAHTLARQARCLANFKLNAAVYMEAVLRNQVWADYMSIWGGDNAPFTVAVELPLQESARGRAFLQDVSTALPTTTVEQELAYWKTFGFDRFQLQWQNRWQAAITETIVVRNALGMQQLVTLKDRSRGAGPYTSQTLFWIPLNDLWNCQEVNRSLIRGTSRYYGDNMSATLPAIDFEVTNGNTNVTGYFVNQPRLFRDHIGPFLSVDCFHLAPPPAMAMAYAIFQRALFQQLVTTHFAAYVALEGTTLAPVPSSWRNHDYYGGNPICSARPRASFVQQTFDFFDDCSKAKPLSVALSANALLFALAAAPASAADICALATPVAQCMATVTAATGLLAQLSLPPTFAPAVAAATASVQASGIGLMQFARTPAGVWTFLQQPLLDTSAFSFFGWLFLFDWSVGAREVVSFQGDAGIVTLVSNVYAPQLYPTGTQPLQNATQILFYLIVVTSVVLVFVGGLTLLYAGLVRLRFLGRNLFFFNRTVGGVWIGRPLCFLRGATAVLLLGTANVALVTEHGLARFTAAPRFWLESLIIVGEATWLTYVMNEVLLVVVGLSRQYAPASSLASWLILFVLELVQPVQVTGTVARHCVGTDMDYAVTCSSGVVSVGSFERVWTIVVIQGGVVIVCLGLASMLQRVYYSPPTKIGEDTLLVSGVAQEFLTASTTSTRDVYVIDYVACVLSGLLPLRFNDRAYTFDLKLWLVLRDTMSTTPFLKALPRPSLAFQSSIPRRASTSTNSRYLSSTRGIPGSTKLSRQSIVNLAAAARWGHAWMALGLGYIVCAIAGSVSYLELSSVTLSNDLFWATFNTTGAHAFIANWLNEQLVVGNTSMANLALDGPSVSVMASFATPTATVTSSANYGAYLQHGPLSTVAAAVNGLRAMDACEAPWIFVPYCFVDFKQTWALANSAARQQRCAKMTANGAVFLESVLRNVNAESFQRCWGAAFDVAIGAELELSSDGRAWLAMTNVYDKAPVAMEVAYWADHGITTYETQWQNYKRLGVLNSYSVTNAFGVVYPLTLQAQNGTYRLGSQTTYKMYWALANDLTAVTTNTTLIGGMSLVRGSANYAYANTTLTAVLTQNGSLASPVPDGFVRIQALLGPFGSIDAVYVAVPASVRAAASSIVEFARLPLANNLAAQALFANITPLDASYPVPGTWLAQGVETFGGSPLCPPLASGYGMAVGLVSVMSFDAACLTSSGVLAKIQPSRLQLVLSALFSGLHATAPPWDFTAVCAHEPTFVTKCQAYLSQTLTYIQRHMLPLPPGLADKLVAATAAVQALDISFMAYTYANATAPVDVIRIALLAPVESNFAFFAWEYLTDWIQGNREVVLFEGDVGSMTLLSDLQVPLSQATQGWQVTANIAQYLHAGVTYMTCIMIAVAILAALYMISSRGHYEGLNMLELGRVGGIVWVGRPLLLLRSMTALALLSTATLELQSSGYMSSFATIPTPWYTTLLAANEVTWLVSIVNDISLVFTQEYSTYYVTINGIVVWVVVAVVTAVAPVTAVTNVDLSCVLVQVDFQAICTSGSIQIGHLERLVTLIGIVLVCNFVCFAVVKAVLGTKPQSHVTSLFLSSGAKYLYCHKNRVYNGVYYLDRASAALNGILSVRYCGHLYALDLKIWRTFVLLVPTASEVPDDHEMAASYKVAYPLLD